MPLFPVMPKSVVVASAGVQQFVEDETECTERYSCSGEVRV